MFDLPLAAVGACMWMDAESKLRKELQREPTENEVRAKLGYPLVVGRATAQYCLSLGLMAGCEVAIKGTPYRISFSRQDDGVGVALLEVPEKVA